MNKDQLYLDSKKQILTMVLESDVSLDEKSLSEQYLNFENTAEGCFS